MFEFVAEFLIKSTIVLVLIGALCSVKGLSAAERHNLATLGLATVAGIAALVWLSGNAAVPDWRIPWPAQAANLIPVEVERPLQTLAEAGAAATTAIQSLQEAAPGVTWWAWAAVVYVAVTLALAASMLAGRRRAARYVRRLALRQSMATGMPKGVDIRVDACATPWTWGIRRPVIVLPENFDAWPKGRQDAALAHELNHISRRDCLADAASRWLCNIFWFQPLVWVLWLRQRRYAESACDDAVLTDGKDPCDYAETLLSIARSNLNAKPMGLAAGSSALRARLQTILNGDTRRSPMTSGKRGILATVALAIMLPVGACSVANSGNIPAALYSAELSPDDVVKYEQRLAAYPDDVAARTRLISHYARTRYIDYGSRRAQAARDAHVRHLVWMIGHVPEARVLERGPNSNVDKRLNPEGYVAVEAAWQSQLDRQPTNAAILDRFAAFLSFADRQRAIGLLRTAQKLDSQNPKWAERLGHQYLGRTIRSGWEAEYPSAPVDALAHFDRAFELHGAGNVPTYVHIGRAKAAFKAKHYALASTHAGAMLRKFEADGHQGDGDLVHQGHTVLGRIALVQGDVERGKEHLLASGRTPGSPVLGSFGPTMVLALELLERGEFGVVAEYLELCADFWEDDRLDTWRKTVAASDLPDFGSSLVY